VLGAQGAGLTQALTTLTSGRIGIAARAAGGGKAPRQEIAVGSSELGSESNHEQDRHALGPVKLNFSGTARILEADESAHRMVLRASG